jgi:eukaryotic translation initiation factor 2C
VETITLNLTTNLGADVTHPGPGQNRPSVASLVSSWDMNGSKYRAYSRVQHPRHEIIADLKDMMKVRASYAGMLF